MSSGRAAWAAKPQPVSAPPQVKEVPGFDIKMSSHLEGKV